MVSDNVPPDVNLSRLEQIEHWIKAFGAVNPGCEVRSEASNLATTRLFYMALPQNLWVGNLGIAVFCLFDRIALVSRG